MIRGQEGRNDKTSFVHIAAKRRTTKKRLCTRIAECIILLVGLQIKIDSVAPKILAVGIFALLYFLLLSADHRTQNTLSGRKFGCLPAVQYDRE